LFRTVVGYKYLVRSHLEYANSVWYPKRASSSAIAERPRDACSTSNRKPILRGGSLRG